MINLDAFDGNLVTTGSTRRFRVRGLRLSPGNHQTRLASAPLQETPMLAQPNQERME
jgi:hypothetical protein